jgi:hypothetical protein
VTRRPRLPPIAKITFGVIVLVGVGLVLKGSISPGPHARCVYACSRPPKALAAPTAGTFTSSRYGFSFEYPPEGRRITVGGAGVTGYNFVDRNGDLLGQMLVTAGTGHQSLSYLIDHEAKKLGHFEIHNVSLSGPMLGAELGFESGVGNLYTGEFTDSIGDVHPVHVGIVAVQHGNEWVSMVGIGASSSTGPTPLIFSVFDDVLDEWRWTR